MANVQAGEKWHKDWYGTESPSGKLYRVWAVYEGHRRIAGDLDEADADAIIANHDGMAALMEALADQRLALRWAWAKLGCRCIFDSEHNKVHEDAHCPIHGLATPEDPEGWEALTQHPHNAQEGD